MNKSTSPYKFVFIHNPGASKTLSVLFKNYSVDAVFMGHAHKYQRGFNYGVRSFITGGGGGPSNGGSLDIKEVSDKRNHFIRVDVEGLKINFTAIDTAGNVIDRLSFNKEKNVTEYIEIPKLPSVPVEQNVSGEQNISEEQNVSEEPIISESLSVLEEQPLYLN